MSPTPVPPPWQDAAKLDRETEELKHKSVDKNVGKLIAQGRAAKGYTQKELATKINEKPQIINEYEQGKGIPNQQVHSHPRAACAHPARYTEIVPPSSTPDRPQNPASGRRCRLFHCWGACLPSSLSYDPIPAVLCLHFGSDPGQN